MRQFARKPVSNRGSGPASLPRRDEAAGRAAGMSGRQVAPVEHDFGRMSVFAGPPVTVETTLKRGNSGGSSEVRGDETGDETVGHSEPRTRGSSQRPAWGERPSLGTGQSLPPAVAPPAAPAAPTSTEVVPSLSFSNDSYVDSGKTSHKVIHFDVTVPIPLDDHKIALVNNIQGHGKFAGGSFWKVKMYGSLVDANFPSMQVDSVDADPVYWSDATSRWNYNLTDTGFFATDDPGPPAYNFDPGDETKFKFKTGLYWLADLPLTTSGSISATPIEEKTWEYSVVADPTTGALTHPAI
jgi:hypothetical protein